MSEFPAHWDFKAIGEFSSRVRRKNTGGECQDPMTISAVDGLVSQRDYFNKIVASKNTEGYTLLHRNEFAYNKSYSDGYPVGAARRLKAKDKGIVSPLYICFELDGEQIDLQFADHLFDSDWFVQAIFGIAKEGARSHGLLNIGIEEFFSAQLPVPPLPEQKKIAEILSGIDNVISRKSIRNEKQTTTTNLILESVFSNSEYRQLPLSEIALLERGKFSHRPRNDPAFYGGKHPFIQTGDIPKSGIRICEHKQTLNEKGLRVSRQFPKGTLVITIAATIGEVGILSYPACFPDSLVGITPNTEECDPVYLHFSLRRLKEKLLQMAPQSAQSNLNLEILGKLLVPLPPLNEQRRLARMICCEDSRASTESTGINKLQHMKNAVASDLLSGRKRVSV